jgi:RNA polymerase sigma-70 factor (ECF subfamily)
MKEDDLRVELERLHPASFGWALRCCRRRRDEAEEVLQMAYLKLLDGTAKFNGKSSLKTWLFAVIRRTASEQRRRQWLRTLALVRWFAARPAPAPAKDPETIAVESEATRRLLDAVLVLPRRQRDLLHLVFYQDLTIEEASRVLGISIGTARTHFDRGKKALRRGLGLEVER